MTSQLQLPIDPAVAGGGRRAAATTGSARRAGRTPSANLIGDTPSARRAGDTPSAKPTAASTGGRHGAQAAPRRRRDDNWRLDEPTRAAGRAGVAAARAALARTGGARPDAA